MSLGLDSAVASKYNEVKKSDGIYYPIDASLSIRVRDEGTDYEWMPLNDCKVGFKHDNVDSDTVFKRYPEEDPSYGKPPYCFYGDVNGSNTSQPANLSFVYLNSVSDNYTHVAVAICDLQETCYEDNTISQVLFVL